MNEINQIGFVKIWCADLSGTREVLSETVGLSIAFEDENVVIFGMQGTQLVLHRAFGENEFRAGTMEIGCYVDNLDALLRRLYKSKAHLSVDRNVVEGQQPLAAVRIPSGQVVEFIQRAVDETTDPDGKSV